MRAQVTIFIIIGIVLVLALVAVFFVVQETGVESPEQQRIAQVMAGMPSAAQAVRKGVEGCVEDLVQKSIIAFGLSGGRVTPDPWHWYFSYNSKLKVPFYYIKGTSYAPAIADVQNILAKHVDQRIEGCVKDSSGLTVTMGMSRTKVEIGPRTVNFVVRMPVKINTGESGIIDLPPEYYESVQVRLRDIVWIAQELVNREVSDDLYIHWDYLASVTNKGFRITAYPQDFATIVYSVTDPDSRILLTEQFTLLFANMMKTRES